MRNPKAYLWLAVGVIALSVLATALGQATTRPAAPTGPTKIAVCDVGEVFQQCREAADLNAELQDRRTAVKAEDDKRVKAADALSLELQGLKPGSEEYQKRFAALEKMELDHKNWRELQERQLRRWHLTMTKDLYGKIVQAVTDVAKEAACQMVLDEDHRGLAGEDLATVLGQIASRKVLYADPNLDITAAVLARMNGQYRPARP